MTNFNKLVLVIMVCLICIFPYSSSFGDMNKGKGRKSHSFSYNPEKQEVIREKSLVLKKQLERGVMLFT